MDLFSELHFAVQVLERDEWHSILVPKLADAFIVKHAGLNRAVRGQTDRLDQDFPHLHLSGSLEIGSRLGLGVAVPVVDILEETCEVSWVEDSEGQAGTLLILMRARS